MNINAEQRDALSEIVNVGIGRAAAALNDMIGHTISLNVPMIDVINDDVLREQWLSAHSQSVSAVSMGFHGAFSGNAALVFPPDSATALVNTLTDDVPISSEMNEMRMGALTEVGNILINGVIGSIGNSLNAHLGFSLPEYLEGKVTEIIDGDHTTMVVANTTFSIDDLKIQGEVILFFELASFKDLLLVIDKELAL